LNYTLNLPVVNPQAEVPGGIQGSSKDAIASASSARNIVSTADFSSWGLARCLDDTTITVGVNNIFDSPPPCVAANLENGYDESTANIKGRTWFVAVKKRF
jgi:outer membrane receptor for ferrienterochelin and colicin